MRKISIIAGWIIGLIVIAIACTKQNTEPVRLTGEAQGTYYAITYYDNQNRNFQSAIDSLFKSFDESASVYSKTSIISRFNRNDSVVIADKVFETIFNKAREISEKTNGAFDITVMPLVNAWGFGYQSRRKVDSAVVEKLLPLIGYKKIRLEGGRLIKEDPAIMIDFNAIAQGYTSDVIGEFLESKGITNYLIDVGGEVLAKGAKDDGSDWKVGIEKPAGDSTSAREVQAIVPLKNRALATSGNYRKYFIENGQRYSHTIDPKTGFPVQHSLLSVSVIADHCISADGYATAFMVMGLEKTKEIAEQNPGLEVYLIYDDNGTNRIWKSKGFHILEE